MKKIAQALLICGICILLQACNSGTPKTAPATPVLEASWSVTPQPEKTVTPVPSATSTTIPSATPTTTLFPTPTSTATATSAAAATSTSQPDAPQAEDPAAGAALVIDHRSVALFDQIPPEYIAKASELLWLHRHASVGANMRFGLDCLANYFPDRPDPSRRPFSCDKDIDAAEIIFDSRYDASNWVFEPHALPNPNPGWYNKTNFFIERLDNLDPGENYSFASYNMGYVEDPTINEHFFSNTNLDDDFPGVHDLEELEARHPDKTIIWWTIALARQTSPHILDFNQQMRAYALENQKILMDIADIESHRPDGTPCTGVDTAENPTELTAICPEYTNESFAGHLNAQGRTRMAKAIWVLMALLAGWDANSP